MSPEEAEFFDIVAKTTEKGRKMKFLRYEKNLRYDLYGIYSYGTRIAELDMRHRTINNLGKWSRTTTKHYNYAKRVLESAYNFMEI
jgi:hypothetical protein